MSSNTPPAWLSVGGRAHASPPHPLFMMSIREIPAQPSVSLPTINAPDPKPAQKTTAMVEVKRSARRPILERLRAVEARYRYVYA